MSILAWRIKRLDKRKSKLRKEYKMWQARYWFYDDKGNDEMKDEILWCLAYVDDELGRTMRKLRKLKRKLK